MIKTLKIRDKRVISILLVFCMLFTLLSGSLAYFTDRVDTVVSAKAGSVSIELDYSGINLKDADGKDILNPGDGRNFNYTVSSTGSKAIDVRETIILSAYDKNLQPLALSDTQSEFEIYKTEDVTYDATKGWIPNDGASPITVKTLDGNTITYTRPVYVLSGNSELDDDKREIEYNDNDEEIPSIQSNELMLIFKAGSSNTYQAAVLKADLLVEAKQHRNTEAVEWIEVQSSTLTISNGNTINVVPGATEFGPQESEDGDWIYKDNGDGTVTIVNTNKVVGDKGTLVIPEKVDGKDVTDVELDNILSNENINEDVTLEFENPEVAKDVEADLIFTYTTDADGVHIVGLTPTGAKLSAVSIPDTIKGQPVLDVDYEGVYNSSYTNYSGHKVLNTIYTNEDVVTTNGADTVFTYTDNGDGTASITGFTNVGKALVTPIAIPETINGLTVTSISTFSGAKMTEITIPSTVTSVAKNTFNNCINLTTVNWNTTAVNTGNSFSGMFTGSPIEEINFGAGITAIPGSFFNSITSTELAINSIENITSIGDAAFNNASNLTDITFNGEVNDGLVIPDTVTTIGGNAFEGTAITSVTVPASVSSLSYNVFVNCPNLTTVNWNTTAVPAIYLGSIQGDFAGSPVEIINLGEGVTSIPKGLFKGIVSTELAINSVEDITSIGDAAFNNATNLTDITFNGEVNEGLVIPDTVTTIGGNAFDNTAITSVTVPASVKTLGASAFANNTNLKIVNYNTTAAAKTSLGNIVGAFGGSPVETLNLGEGIAVLPEGVLAGITSTEVEINSTEDITTINNGVFRNASNLTDVTFNGIVNDGFVIPDTVTTIGEKVFENCTSITNIVIPNTVTIVKTRAFNNWTSTQTIYVEGKTDVSGFATSTGLTSNCNATIVYKGITE